MNGSPPESHGRSGKFRLLCVDDEPMVVQGVSLQVRRFCDVVGAHSGDEGLVALRDKGPFAVVLSDMRMPGMDGATFLARVRDESPDTTRVLLTGHAEISAAIAAVNRAGIFRFLTKPCPPEELRLALEAAADQHRLVTAERELLEQTLRGSVKALADILALTSPAAFGRASRLRRYALEIAERLGLADRWALEVAAVLSQLGSVTLPDTVLDKVERAAPLSAEEQAMVDRTGTVTAGLLARIPRLDAVRSILARAALMPSPDDERSAAVPTELALAAKVLRLAADFELLESAGDTPQRALEVLLGRHGRYDPALLDALRRARADLNPTLEVREVGARQLIKGMVLAHDLRTTSGVLLVARGYEVNASLLERLRNYGLSYIREPIRVIVSK